MRVLVAGAGALGSTLAVLLARAGVEVTLADPADLGANASGVAAGMLAPVFETLFDAAAPALDQLLSARDLWPAFAASIGVDLGRAGAMAVGSADELDAWQGGLESHGLAALRLTADQARERSPGLASGLGGLWTGEDWRLEPRSALLALQAALSRQGGRLLRAGVAAFATGQARLTNGERLAADALVIATGASRSLANIAPGLSTLIPVKGHILCLPEVDLIGPVLRMADGYLCPSAFGALVGATMEQGREDATVDPALAKLLRAMAAKAHPAVKEAVAVAATGVRAATADGRPLVGASTAPGVWLAVGARRNGWLLAPRIAQTLLEAMAIPQRP